MKDKTIIEWNPGQGMSKEFAVEAIEMIVQFYRRLYYQPQIKPFSCPEDFETATEVLNGLKIFIERSSME